MNGSPRNTIVVTPSDLYLAISSAALAGMFGRSRMYGSLKA